MCRSSWRDGGRQAAPCDTETVILKEMESKHLIVGLEAKAEAFGLHKALTCVVIKCYQ